MKVALRIIAKMGFPSDKYQKDWTQPRIPVFLKGSVVIGNHWESESERLTTNDIAESLKASGNNCTKNQAFALFGGKLTVIHST